MASRSLLLGGTYGRETIVNLDCVWSNVDDDMGQYGTV